MNVFSSLFGIFRQRGLVTALKEDRRLAGFVLAAGLLSILGGGLYGFAMGIGLGIDTAIKDAIKVALIAGLTPCPSPWWRRWPSSWSSPRRWC
jgi:hypothetical protein